MKKKLLLFMLIFSVVFGFGQTISPAETLDYCPHFDYNNANIAQPNVHMFTINFGSSSPRDYQIIVGAASNNPVACKVVSNINDAGQCYIAFQDQRDQTPQFSIRHVQSGGLVKTFKFPLIKSLKGLKPHIIFPPNIQLPLCNTGNIVYSVDTMVKYKRTDDDKEFGSFIPYYEYSVPEGWKVAGVTSTGQNNYILAGPGATITYDEVHKGEIKIRASQQNYQCFVTGQTPVAGEWFSIPFTRPDLKFSVNGGATAVNVTCGTTTSHTFTVENGPSNACLSYVWNLGSAGNNWLYNGSPADQFITTTTNSISLTTATCTGEPGDVSVAVRFNNTDLKVFSAIPVTMQVPQYSITGAGVLCNAENYVIENLPCNATVDWSIESFWPGPAAPATLTANGAAATLTKTDNGIMTLKATISGLCATSPVILTKDIKLGPPTTFTGSVFTGGALHALKQCNNLTTPYASGEWVGYVTIDDPVATYYGWQLYDKKTNTAPLLMYTPDAQHVEVRIKAPQEGWALWELARRNACGVTVTTHGFRGNWVCPNEVRMDVSNEHDTEDAASTDAITLAPNPANNQVTIAIKKSNAIEKITEVKIFDVLGRLSRRQRFNNATSVTLHINDLLNGLYFVEITQGAKKIKKNLQVNR